MSRNRLGISQRRLATVVMDVDEQSCEKVSAYETFGGS
jgi:hypothetical protein